MRLLNTTTTRVIEVYGAAIPPYAILSHTWYEEEVLLQDLQRSNIKNQRWKSLDSQSFRGNGKVRSLVKLIGSTNLAQQNEFSHVWVDTCCIDKTSSAELSEAINSMYQWYAGADVCYAYLSDVPNAETEDPAGAGSKFRLSRWFKRGWTLQELIASPQVLFYASDWSYLGAKTGDLAFARILNEITGIQLEVLLRELPPQDVSIATRMRWAAGRQTTRVEDIAYCLLGIFDINMPLLYGEGKRSFIRLQEAILVKEEDQSLFAWHAEPLSALAIGDVWQSGSFCGLLADSPERFWEDHDIETAMPLILESSPSAVTSRGLGVDFLLLPCDKDQISYDADFRVILNCERLRDGVRESPVIYLKRIWGIGDQFARVRADLREFVPPADVSLLKDGLNERIFVRQDPSSDMRTINIVAAKDTSQLKLLDDSRIATGWKVKDAWPKQGWVEKTQTFQTRELTFGLPCGVLRLETENTENPLTMDVAIGMHASGRSCRSWCQIMNLNPDSKPEGAFTWATSEAKSAKVKYNGTSTRDIHGTDTPVWILVTERNRKKRLDITLHILTNKDVDAVVPVVRNYQQDLDNYAQIIPLSTLLDVELKVDTILSIPPPLESWASRAEAIWSSWCLDIATLLREKCVVDSIDISIFPRVSFGSKIRIGPEGGISQSLGSLREFCLNAVPTDDHLSRRLIHHLCEGGQTDRIQAMQMLNIRTDMFLQLRPIHWAIIGGNEETVLDLLADDGTKARWLYEERLTDVHLALLLPEPSVLKCIHMYYHSHGDLTGSLRDFDSLPPIVSTEDYPMHFAAAYAKAPAYWTVVPKLLDYAGCINALGETPLHRAAAMGNPAAVRFLLRNVDVKVDALDNFSRTPLWHAACNDQTGQISEDLLQNGALTNLTDEDGLAPIHIACRQGAFGCLKSLIARNANINVPLGALGLLPTHLATIFGQAKCLSTLIRHNAGLIAYGEQDVTVDALHLAIANRQVTCARLIWNSLNPKPSLKDWSLCIVLVNSAPVLKWMYVEVSDQYWYAVEDPGKEGEGVRSLVRLSQEGLLPELWGAPGND